MIAIEPSFEILDLKTREDGIKLLRRVEYLARISHRSEEKQTADSWERVIASAVMQKGDWSVTEHCSVTVIARVDRGVTHEWVRHRIGSYTQESTRFVNYGGRDIEFVRPSFAGDDPVSASAAWHASMYEAEQSYKDQLTLKQPPQIARSVLPNATASTIAVTYNLRNWRFFFMSRDTKETHPDFRRLVVPLLGKFQELIPLLYDDLTPGMKQSISFTRPR